MNRRHDARSQLRGRLLGEEAAQEPHAAAQRLQLARAGRARIQVPLERSKIRSGQLAVYVC
jgi:hypothetical protein